MNSPWLLCDSIAKHCVLLMACTSDWFKGYGSKQSHPMYRTSNSVYGSSKPSVHTMHTCFHTKSQEFTSVSITPSSLYDISKI